MSYPICKHGHSSENIPCLLCLQEETRAADRMYTQQLRDKLEEALHRETACIKVIAKMEEALREAAKTPVEQGHFSGMTQTTMNEVVSAIALATPYLKPEDRK